MELPFAWTTLRVRNMEQSLHFYHEILGLPIDRRMKPAPEREIVFLGSGPTKVELIADPDTGPVTCGDSLSIGFVVPSVDEFIEALRAQQIPVHAGPIQPNPHIRFFYVLDPDGLQVQFVEHIRE
ncbi:MAG: VOC family protein [Alkalispirochaeta sp.]